MYWTANCVHDVLVVGEHQGSEHLALDVVAVADFHAAHAGDVHHFGGLERVRQVPARAGMVVSRNCRSAAPGALAFVDDVKAAREPHGDYQAQQQARPPPTIFASGHRRRVIPYHRRAGRTADSLRLKSRQISSGRAGLVYCRPLAPLRIVQRHQDAERSERSLR
jgi:hypothetical protein